MDMIHVAFLKLRDVDSKAGKLSQCMHNLCISFTSTWILNVADITQIPILLPYYSHITRIPVQVMSKEQSGFEKNKISIRPIQA